MHFATRKKKVRVNTSNNPAIPVASDVTPIVSTSDVTQTTGGAILTSPSPIPSTFLSQTPMAGIVVSPQPQPSKKQVTHALGRVH